MELVEVIDENGKSTGEILPLEEVHKKNLLHSGVIVFIVNDKKQVLLERRSLKEEYASGKWALLGGHVKAHESKEDAAIREIFEEIGLKVNKNDLKPFGNKDIDIDKPAHIFYFYYVKFLLNENEFDLDKSEVSEVKWFDIDEVIELTKNNDERIIAKPQRLYLFDLIKKEL